MAPIAGMTKLEEMEFNDVIKREDLRGTDYRLQISGGDLAGYGEYTRIKSKLEEILSVLPDLQFRTLELYSTVHYSFKSLKLVRDEVREESVMSQVRQWKGDGFSGDEIREALKTMRDGGLIED